MGNIIEGNFNLGKKPASTVSIPNTSKIDKSEKIIPIKPKTKKEEVKDFIDSQDLINKTNEELVKLAGEISDMIIPDDDK